MNVGGNSESGVETAKLPEQLANVRGRWAARAELIELLESGWNRCRVMIGGHFFRGITLSRCCGCGDGTANREVPHSRIDNEVSAQDTCCLD